MRDPHAPTGRFLATSHRLALAASLAFAPSCVAAMAFVHPGSLDSEEELQFVKTKIAQGAQPWTAQFARLKATTSGGSNALTSINSADADANTSKADARRAYANALAWKYTGQESYATRAITILNDWSKLEGFTAGTDQDKLQAGWIGALFAPAAEIMRGHPGWTAENIAAFQAMFRRAFYPQLVTMSRWNGNVDLTQIDAMMSIAVFNEDEALFRMGLERLAKRNASYFHLTDSAVPPIAGDNGDIETFWSSPTRWVDGLTQETCRDNNHHAQYAMASAFHAAEVAWHQGVDVYTPNQRRYVATLELMGKQIASGSMQGTCADDQTTTSRFATWEIGYNHYHNRMGIDLPNAWSAITEQIRPKGVSDWNIFYETLTHADLPTTTSLRSPPEARAGLRMRALAGNRFEITASRTGAVEILVSTPDGRLLERVSVFLVEGETRSMHLDPHGSETGIRIVRAGTPDGGVGLVVTN